MMEPSRLIEDGIFRGLSPRRRSKGAIWLLAGVAAVLGLSGCGDPPPAPSSNASRASERRNQLQIEDVEVSITSGTLAMRGVRADFAVFHEDSRFLEGSSITLQIRLPKHALDLAAHASRGEVCLAPNRKPPKEETFDESPVGYPAMRDLVYQPEEQRPFGDVILFGPVQGRTSDGGTFQTQTVYWSEKHKRLMVPHPFKQTAFLPDGGSLAMTGTAFEVDSTLRKWVYYGDTEPWVLMYEVAPPPPSPKSGSALSSD